MFSTFAQLLVVLFAFMLPLGAMAQVTGDDAYDPFADYSEFEEASQEEADINFFQNGRFLNLGLLLGSRSFTGTYGDIYGTAPNFGLFLSYFFDLRFALQVSYVTGDHTLGIKTTAEDINGNVSLSSTSFSMKYYFNTQNVTRGLADLNPYVLAGFSKHERTVTRTGIDTYGQDSANSFDLGVGIEIPISRNSMFVGVQAWYYLTTFDDENQEMKADVGGVEGQPLGIIPKGDPLNILAIFGVNF